MAVYPVTGEPPFETGAVQAMSAEAESLPASTAVGGPGTVAGVALAGADGVPFPMALSARTVMV